MTKPDYADRGAININFNTNPDTREQFPLVANITQPNETQSRKVNLTPTAGGHFKGYAQPSSAEETLERAQFKAEIAKGIIPAGAAEDPNVELTLRQDGKKVLPVYVYKDVLIAGEPLSLIPNEVFMFSGKNQAVEYDQGVADGTIDPSTAKRPPRFHGYAADMNGSLTEPAAFERQATMDKDGNQLRQAKTFYSGDNRSYDFAANLARQEAQSKKTKSTAKAKAAGDRVMSGDAAEIMDL